MTRPNILFVCSKNQWRSPTAEAIYRNDDRISVRSRGTATAATQSIQASDIAWADAILVMEVKHRQRILLYVFFASNACSGLGCQHPDIPINADTQQNSPRSMNNLKEFLKATTFAVAGASRDRSKYGNKVFVALVASGRCVYPLNPTQIEVEGHPAFASIADLPKVPESLSIITPPHVTRDVANHAIAAGVKNIWMQPGAEDSKGSQAAREAGLNVIDDGSCILVLLARENRG